MLSATCYFLTYIFEALISLLFFSQKYSSKHSKPIIFAGFAVSVLLQFGISYIGIPILNLVAFFVFNFLLCFLLFKTGVWQSLFTSLILSASMLITEMCIFHLSTLLFGVHTSVHTENDTILWIQASCAKLLYFFVVYLILKLSISEQRKELRSSKASLLLLLPLASIVLLAGVSRIMEITKVSENVFYVFIISVVLLLYSNIVVFWIHESMIKIQKENLEHRLLKQKAELDTEYYTILQAQYENSNILIHDIKRHLLSIKEFANDEQYQRIINYIDNLYDNYQIKYLRKYSDHKLVNAIANRYVEACKEYDIDFFCDVRDVDFSFISDIHLTSLLDNLLENAVEAAKESEDKIIEISVKNTNSNFVVITLVNSCSSAPKNDGKELKTTKKNKEIHGFGIKSIKRIAKEYDGSVDFIFDKSTMRFTFSVVLKTE